MVEYINHPLIKKDAVESRLYQKVIASDVLKSGNSMIVAPTALGKTLMAVLVAADRLNKFKESKVLLLAPSKPLALQHEKTFKEFLKVKTGLITGAVAVKKRTDIWDESDIICATPQTIESDLINRRYTLKDVSLIVFDECHHAVGSYSYVYLANKYIKDNKNSLILGLTASPGYDEDKIKVISENLFIEKIIIKSEEDEDVKPYFNPIKMEWVKIEMNDELKEIKKYIDIALNHRLKMLKNLKIIKTINVGKIDILKARSKVQNKIGRSLIPPKECYRAMSILSAVITLQHSIELVETQGISPLYNYLEKTSKKTSKASKGLMMDPDFSKAILLTKTAKNKSIEHPKINKLMEILEEELKEKNSKVIVFTQFRDTLDMISRHCKIKGIDSLEFYGQGSRDGKKGLSQKEQKKILEQFENEDNNVLISTSVAEEGIDIPAVDLVILYEPVPSEIRMIQRRGRTGRKDSGRIKILITKGTRDESYYWSSKNKEKKMKTHLYNKSTVENINTRPMTKDNLSIQYNKKEIIEEEKSSKDKIKIYADTRESNSLVLRSLDNMDVEIDMKPLSVGDYQINNEIAIERKTTQDFLDSIVDKRLYKQAKSLTEEFKKPIMIIEGDDLYSGFIQPNAVRGAIASIAIDFSIPIIPTRSEEDTALMIYRIAKREGTSENRPVQTRTEKKPSNLTEQQLFIVESLPNVGPVTAKKILKEFKTIENIVKADEEEIKKIDGIGSKIAKNIKEVLTSEFR